MARHKQTQKQQKDKDGKHRRETKEEKRARLQSQQEARQACEKLIPYIAGGVVLLLLVFALYVRSIPPKMVPASLEDDLGITPMDAVPPLEPPPVPLEPEDTVKVVEEEERVEL